MWLEVPFWVLSVPRLYPWSRRIIWGEYHSEIVLLSGRFSERWVSWFGAHTTTSNSTFCWPCAGSAWLILSLKPFIKGNCPVYLLADDTRGFLTHVIKICHYKFLRVPNNKKTILSFICLYWGICIAGLLTKQKSIPPWKQKHEEWANITIKSDKSCKCVWMCMDAYVTYVYVYRQMHTCMCLHVRVYMHICPICLCICVWVCQAIKRTFVVTSILSSTIQLVQEPLGYILGNVKSQVLCKNDRIQNRHQKIVMYMNRFLNSWL